MKILYVSIVSGTVNAFLIPHIKILINKGHQVDVAFNIKKEVKPIITEMGCKIYNLEFQRSPFKKENYQAYKKLKNLILNEGYDLVHAHTHIASACVRLACRKNKNVMVFYTVHGFYFFKGGPITNWLIYYPVERWLSKYTDRLITINNEDYIMAKKFLSAEKVKYIPGVGLDVAKFSNTKINKIKKRKELGLPEDSFVLISVGELNKNKNHETVIKALAKLKQSHIQYIICGQGPLGDYLKKLIKRLGVEEQVHLLGYRKDVAEIYKASDIFVLPSKREGLNVSLMEAMASGLPIVCSDIRGNNDLIEDGKGGYLVNSGDVEGFAKKINCIKTDKELRNLMCQNNLKIIKNYDIQNVTKYISDIYN